MKMHIYHIPGANGGYCLYQPDRGVWEGYEINIPDEVVEGISAFDELPILTLGGQSWHISQVLSSWGGKPCFRWEEGGKERRMMLE